MSTRSFFTMTILVAGLASTACGLSIPGEPISLGGPLVSLSHDHDDNDHPTASKPPAVGQPAPAWTPPLASTAPVLVRVPPLRGPQPPSATTAPAPSGPGGCAGVPMLAGQSDVDVNPAGTTFCLSGVHSWTLAPKSGDRFVGPATLDGQNRLQAAFVGNAQAVDIESLSLTRYAGGDQQGAINPDSGAARWVMRNLDVGFNNNVGIDPPAYSQILGGRLHDNGQEGAGGQVGDGVLVDSVEIDHNNSHHVDCGYEAGGFKWVANNVTVRNSRIHDNFCKGLWSDINSTGSTIVGNQVYDNWAEGIFIEISNHATVSGNNIWGNGFHTDNGGGCSWLWGGGITAASSAFVTVTGNTVTNNCNGITGTQQDRPDGSPGLLESFVVQNNTIAGRGQSGAAQDNGANLAARNIVFAGDRFLGGQAFCGVAC